MALLLDTALQRALGLPPAHQRAVAAIVGAAVADAAAAPLHWCYDPAKLKEELGDAPPAFAPPQNPFYRVSPGSNSCYGDQLRCVARSLGRKDGKVDLADQAAALRERMTDEDYERTAAVPRRRRNLGKRLWCWIAGVVALVLTP